MRFGSTAKVLAKCMLKYYRISECHMQLDVQVKMRALGWALPDGSLHPRGSRGGRRIGWAPRCRGQPARTPPPPWAALHEVPWPAESWKLHRNNPALPACCSALHWKPWQCLHKSACGGLVCVCEVRPVSLVTSCVCVCVCFMSVGAHLDRTL